MIKKLLPIPEIIDEAKRTSKGHNLWIELLIFILVFFIINVAQVIIVLPGQIYYMFKNQDFMSAINNGDLSKVEELSDTMTSVMPDTYTIMMLFSTFIIILLSIIYCRFIEKRSVRSMGFCKQGFIKEYGLGILVGALMFSLAVLFCAITGTITLSFSPQIALGTILLFFVGYMVQGMSEEVLCRGYFMVSVARKNSLIAAVLANSLLFALFHLLNEGISILGIINLILFGIFASLYMIKRGDIWGIAALHTTWNFVQGNVFGIKVSGLNIKSSLFTTTIKENLSIINGGSFGLEGGLAVTLVLIIGIFLITMLKGKTINHDISNM